MGMNDTTSGMGWIGVLFVILIVWGILGGGFASANRSTGGSSGGGGSEMTGTYAGWQAEKQEIIDSAKTQYMIEQQGAQTRAEAQAGFNSIMEQNRAIYEQGLQEKMFDLKAEVSALKQSAETKDGFHRVEVQIAENNCAINRRLDAIECSMLTKPALSGIATTCGQVFSPGYYFGGYGAPGTVIT